MSTSSASSVRTAMEQVARLRHELDTLADADAGAGMSLRKIHVASTELRSAVARIAPVVRELELQADAAIGAGAGETSEDFDPLELDRYSRVHEMCRALSEQAADLHGLEVQIERARSALTFGLAERGGMLRRAREGLARIAPHSEATLRGELEAHARGVAEERGVELELALETHGLEGAESAELPALGAFLCALLECPIVEAAANAPASGTALRIGLRLERGHDAVAVSMTADGAGVALCGWGGDGRGAHRDAAFDRALGEVRRSLRRHGGWMRLPASDGEELRAGFALPRSELAVLFIVCGEAVVGIANSDLQGVVRLKDLSREGETVCIDAERLSTLDLASVVAGNGAAQSSGARHYAALLRHGEQRCALLFDRIHANARARLIPLADPLPRLSSAKAATVLEDGRTVLVLDAKALLGPEPAARGAGAEERESQAPRVMVVDDSVTIRKVTERILRRNKLSVQLARDGREALEMVSAEAPDLILLDIEMPRMNGFQLAEALHADPALSSIPVIMISSRAGDKHRERAAELGVRAFLGKPFKERELMTVIGEILEWQP